MLKYAAIQTESELRKVLEMCWRILDVDENDEQYGYIPFLSRMPKYSGVLVYAHEDGTPVAAVLGRPESPESLVLGMTACEKGYRGRGISRKLIRLLEENAAKLGFRYITLGAAETAEGFYEKCGYSVIFEIHGQKIFQKIL